MSLSAKRNCLPCHLFNIRNSSIKLVVVAGLGVRETAEVISDKSIRWWLLTVNRTYTVFLSQSDSRMQLPEKAQIAENGRPCKDFNQAGWIGRDPPPRTPLSSPAVSHQGSASAAPTSRPYSTGSASTHRRPSATLIARELLRTQGLWGLYRGLGATLLR